MDVLADANASSLAWLPGARDDVAQALRSFDAFVLPSLAEGISNTILEAMASGLPVIATRVGGNAELVNDGVTGTLVPSADSEALAQAMLRCARDPGFARGQGSAGRERALRLFSLDVMVGRYTALYDRLLSDPRRARRLNARRDKGTRRDGQRDGDPLTMCGITGIFDTRGRRDIDRATLSRMNESQHHRGPDEGGLHVEPGVGLGHRRLSIIDLSTGQQPLYNEDRSVCIVYNGEVYNYQALIAELTALGYRFHTRSDTEAIVHAWEAWGEDCVERLRGMFAFALWDRNRETLFLARDRLGVKPLHYALLPDGTLLFGSELKSLLAHGGLRREIDPLAVEEYFALGYVAEPRTIFRGARKLPPAHTLDDPSRPAGARAARILGRALLVRDVDRSRRRPARS